MVSAVVFNENCSVPLILGLSLGVSVVPNLLHRFRDYHTSSFYHSTSVPSLFTELKYQSTVKDLQHPWRLGQIWYKSSLVTSLLVLTDWVSSGNIPRYLVQAELYVYIIILLLSFCNYQQISASKSYSAICFHGLESTQSQEQNIGISIFRQSFKLDTEHFHFRFDEIPPGVFCFIKTFVFK